jgi:hypothetical protein
MVFEPAELRNADPNVAPILVRHSWLQHNVDTLKRFAALNLKCWLHVHLGLSASCSTMLPDDVIASGWARRCGGYQDTSHDVTVTSRHLGLARRQWLPGHKPQRHDRQEAQAQVTFAQRHSGFTALPCKPACILACMYLCYTGGKRVNRESKSDPA